jgi:hypothetical protein
MTELPDDWSELQRTWQSRTEPGAMELEKVRSRIARARRAAAMRTALDAGACVVGAVLGTWALLRGTASGLVVGLAALAFTAYGAWLAWRSARLRRPVVAGSVTEALDAAIALERSAEGWARAMVPMAAAATAFLAVVVLTAAWEPGSDAARLRRQLGFVGVALLLLAAGSIAGQWLERRARRRREVLERRRRELEA